MKNQNISYFAKFLRSSVSTITLLVLTLTLLITPIYAETELDYITDTTETLTTTEWNDIKSQAKTASERLQFGIYAIMVNDYTEFTDRETIFEFAKEVYSSYNLGLGPNKDGILLVVSLEDRDYTILTSAFGNTAFTDYGKSILANEFIDDFGSDSWYSGLQDYITKSSELVELAKSGQPLTSKNDPRLLVMSISISFALGALISIIICFILKRKMKSVAQKIEARNYIPEDKIRFTYKDDRFIHTTTTRTKVSSKSSSSGGGGEMTGKSGKF